MTKIRKLANIANEKFREILASEMRERFSVEIETNYNLFSGNIVSIRTDGQDFTKEQHDFMRAFGDGYGAVMKIMREA